VEAGEATILVAPAQVMEANAVPVGGGGRQSPILRWKRPAPAQHIHGSGGGRRCVGSPSRRRPWEGRRGMEFES
jgi:hypothetical protein